MKRRRLGILLVVVGFTGLFVTLFSFVGRLWEFPLGFIGKGLRRLSLSGSLGNGLAVMLFVAVCLLPVYLLYRQRKKRPLFAEDALLVLLSLLLVPLLYGAVNPGRLWQTGGPDMSDPFGIAVIGSIGVAYGVFRMTRESQGSEQRLIRLLRFLLYGAAIYFVLAVTVGAASQTAESYRGILANAAGGQQANPVEWGMLWFGFLAGAVPNALGLFTILLSLDWLDASARDRYSEASLQAAAKLAEWSRKALVISMLVHLVYQLLQLFLISRLAHARFSIHIPVFSVFFVLAALLFARRAEADCAMKQENDLFI